MDNIGDLAGPMVTGIRLWDWRRKQPDSSSAGRSRDRFGN